ncbi:hypothetical protein [Pseudorhodoferax sp.]|uniref:hypothetical protein n=1 Tax=Pseudorhodoferax sp. TaxID=1993553 RepID=UPI0039E4780A
MVAAPSMSEAGLPRRQRWQQRGNQAPTHRAERLPRERFSPTLQSCHWEDDGYEASPVVLEPLPMAFSLTDSRWLIEWALIRLHR